jgi:ribonucleotide monophosphatase NagD (HAD superfamily)
LLLDLEGVLYEGGRTIVGAAEAVGALRDDA